MPEDLLEASAAKTDLDTSEETRRTLGAIAASIEDKMQFGETLEPVDVYRDGPRFYCARVTNGEKEFVVKDAIKKSDHANDMEDLNSPTTHLVTEIEIVGFLNAKLAPDSMITSTLIMANKDRQPWYATEYLTGGLGDNFSPFFFNREALRQTDPSVVFKTIQTLQSFTHDPDMPEWITSQRRADHVGMDFSREFMDFFSERTGTPREQVQAAYDRAMQIRKDSPKVVIHGEVYPPHLFVAEGAQQAQLIDWENAKLGDRYSDHAAVWLRACEAETKDWQEAYYKLVSEQEDFDEQGWQSAVLTAAMGNYWYLSGDSDKTEVGRRDQAAQFCREAAIKAYDALKPNPA